MTGIYLIDAWLVALTIMGLASVTLCLLEKLEVVDVLKANMLFEYSAIVSASAGITTIIVGALQ